MSFCVTMERSSRHCCGKHNEKCWLPKLVFFEFSSYFTFAIPYDLPPTVVPGLLTAGRLAAMDTAVDQLALALKDPLYLGLQQVLPAETGAAQPMSRSDRCAWRKLVATLTAIVEGVMS
jgi:hypothetical protein